jgi:pimeloyl-ACP methyl ester carboxylesterase
VPEAVVNGVKLSYEVRGEGPPVLLICGALQPASTWWLFGGQTLVDNGHTVIAFDNRGVPPSDVPPPPYTIEDMAADAIGLMEHIGLGPYAVLGGSLGGLIAQTVALRRPDLVRCVVLAVSGGDSCAFTRSWAAWVVDVLATGIELPPSLLAWMMLPFMLPPDQLQDDEAVNGALAMAGVFGTLPRDAVMGHFSAALKWADEDHVTELQGLRVPALAVASEHDLCFPPAHVKRAVAAMPHGEYAEIAGAPHFAMDKLDEVMAAEIAFLAKHVPAKV